jgi:hypothetical protein
LLKPDEDVRWHAAGSYIRLCSPELPTSKACSARLSCENVPQHTYAPGLPALEPAMASLRPSPEPRCAWPSIHSENPGSAGWKCKEPAAWLGAELKILGGWQSADALPCAYQSHLEAGGMTARVAGVRLPSAALLRKSPLGNPAHHATAVYR